MHAIGSESDEQATDYRTSIKRVRELRERLRCIREEFRNAKSNLLVSSSQAVANGRVSVDPELPPPVAPIEDDDASEGIPTQHNRVGLVVSKEVIDKNVLNRQHSDETAKTVSTTSDNSTSPSPSPTPKAGMREDDLQEQVRVLTNQNQILSNQNHILSNENQVLSERSANIPSLKCELILAFLAGTIGFAPPLWYTNNIFVKCEGGGCNRGLHSRDGHGPRELIGDTDDDRDHGDDQSSDNVARCTWIKRIWAGIRLVFFFAIFLVDFADAVLDIAVAPDVILEDPFEPRFFGWTFLVMIMTILARTLGGMFAVIYTRIDNSDRDLSYFVVELTIFVMEDMAAYSFLGMKRTHGVEWTTVERINAGLTYICAFVFLGAILCQCKTIAEKLPPCASRIFLTWYAIWVFNLTISLLFLKDLAKKHLSVSAQESMLRFHYIILLIMQLVILCHWSRYLYRKTTTEHQGQEEQEDPENGSSMLTLQEVVPDPP